MRTMHRSIIDVQIIGDISGSTGIRLRSPLRLKSTSLRLTSADDDAIFCWSRQKRSLQVFVLNGHSSAPLFLSLLGRAFILSLQRPRITVVALRCPLLLRSIATYKPQSSALFNPLRVTAVVGYVKWARYIYTHEELQ